MAINHASTDHLGWLKLLNFLMMFSQPTVPQCLDLKSCTKASTLLLSRSSKSTSFSYSNPETLSLLFCGTPGMVEMLFVFLTLVFRQDVTNFLNLFSQPCTNLRLFEDSWFSSFIDWRIWVTV